MSLELVGVLILLGVGWFWWDSVKKREMAVLTARAVCQRSGVQFLDDTVSLDRLALGRDHNQRVAIRRDFAFEYSDTGDNRMPGRVYLLGSQVLDVNLIRLRD